MSDTNKAQAITDEFKDWFEREWSSYQDKAISGGKVVSMAWALKGYRALLASKPAVPQPVAVYPQGVMGIPPYSPPGSGSITVEPGISWSAAAPAQPDKT